MVMVICSMPALFFARFAQAFALDHLSALRDLAEDREVPKNLRTCLFNKKSRIRTVDRSIIYSVLESNPRES